jgi:hypothetical protein
MAYGLVVALFTWLMASFYLPGKGFTYLIGFGGVNHGHFLPELRATNHYEHPNSVGYDGQSYAQIAMDPHLSDPALDEAVDYLPYRARRILFEWTAWLAGGGNPRRVMCAYAVQNIVCWYILAALLLRWLPPTSWGNGFRWAAVLFAFGLIFSVKGALLDGPGLLFVAIGVALIESGRSLSGSLVLGLAGLGKDTSILGASALELPAPRDRRSWARWFGQVALVVLPLVIWEIVLTLWIGRSDHIGVSNFAGAFSGLVTKVRSTFSSLATERFMGPSVAKYDAAVVIGLLTQFCFFGFRVRWRDSWWRVGASYAVLLIFLGNSVWESYPLAAARVLVPMTLAFNILVPRGRWWFVVLLLGNLGVLGSAELLRPPAREVDSVVEGPSELRIDPATYFRFEAEFTGANWCIAERARSLDKKRLDYWRWSLGDGAVKVHNPQPFAVVADVSYDLATVDARLASLSYDGRSVWQGMLKPSQANYAFASGLVFPPGDSLLIFKSDRAGAAPGPGDARLLAFSVRNLAFELKARAAAP